MFHDLSDWLTYLENIHPTKIDLSLDRITKVALKLELLQFSSKVIVVGGTNGKGTTCALIESVLCANQYKVGVFSSPHISKFNERIRLNRQDVKDDILIDAFKIINSKRCNISLTYFEYTTLAALYIFKHSNLDFIVLEIGLGGRLDAVNIVHRDVAIITSIGIDHIHYLGDTIDSIGYEKAHIYKDDCYAIFGDHRLPQSVNKYSIDNNIDLHAIDDSFNYDINDKTINWHSGDYDIRDLYLPIIVPSNLACTLECFKALGLTELLNTEVLNNVLRKFNLFGRFTIVQKNFSIIFDVAHNVQAIENLYKNLYETKGNSIAIFAMCKDKDVYKTVKILGSCFEHWYILLFNNDTRMASVTDYDKIFQNLAIKNYTYINSDNEVQKISKSLNNTDQMVVFGSFRTIERIKKIFVTEKEEIDLFVPIIAP